MIKVYGKPIRVNKASQDKKTQDVGANLFIGNIDPDVDEKVPRQAHVSLTQRHFLWGPEHSLIAEQGSVLVVVEHC